MSKKGRDFYHIQDQLPLAWRYSTEARVPIDPEVESLSLRIDELADIIPSSSPEIIALTDLMFQKISILERALTVFSSQDRRGLDLSHSDKKKVEVSLSSSGLGFFSELFAEEDSEIEIALTLDTVNSDIEMRATVLESRQSADSENPGYWVRVRFTSGQEDLINQIVAHVAQRQIEKLERKESPVAS